MAAAKARRTGRSILAVTTTLTVTLAVAAPGLVPAGSAATPGRPHAHAADACDGSVGLQVSDRRPLQLRPVRVAAISSVPPDAVVFYDFNYGDGSDDAGAQPNAVHAYQDTGDYAVKVTVVTTCNTMVSSPELRVVVGDGLPPDVAIGFPHADQTAHFGRAGLLLQGTARDPSGVRKVELAMQVLRVTRSATRAGAAGATAAPGSGLRLPAVLPGPRHRDPLVVSDESPVADPARRLHRPGPGDRPPREREHHLLA
jgi:hypothetical protein